MKASERFWPVGLGAMGPGERGGSIHPDEMVAKHALDPGNKPIQDTIEFRERRRVIDRHVSVRLQVDTCMGSLDCRGLQTEPATLSTSDPLIDTPISNTLEVPGTHADHQIGYSNAQSAE